MWKKLSSDCHCFLGKMGENSLLSVRPEEILEAWGDDLGVGRLQSC